MIPVNKPFLPPIEDYQQMVEGIWQRNWLTNNGPLVNELELELKHYLNVPFVLFTANGTLALQMAIRALELKGEVITSPYSFVATTSSIVWEGCTPVMVDIDPLTLNIDPVQIEAAITPNTSAIVATHMFGNPCDIEAIEAIAEKHGLKVIYDAAHCFGTKYKGRSVFTYGDVTITSFHATKVFHSIEGGAVFTKDPELLKKIAFMRNFGLDGIENFACLGINAKNSEFHAAMGLANLKHVFTVLEKRKQDYLYYSQLLSGLQKQEQAINKHAEINYAYYPIILPSEEVLKKMVELLNGHSIYARRYFYPSLNTLPYVKEAECRHCVDIAARTLCLPLYYELSKEEIHFCSADPAAVTKQLRNEACHNAAILFPYMGYFQLICAADRFILLDEVQYIRHGWINRNRMLKPADGHQYIVAPLKKHAQKASIKEVAVVDGDSWKQKIIRQIEHYKKKAPFYSTVKALLEDCFSVNETNMATLNAIYLKRVLKHLGLHPSVSLASDLQLDYSNVGDSGEWALRICEQLNATAYINPVGGASLFDRKKFEQSNIALNFLQPVLQPYNQYRPLFEEGLSILDVIMFNPVETICEMIKQHRIL